MKPNKGGRQGPGSEERRPRQDADETPAGATGIPSVNLFSEEFVDYLDRNPAMMRAFVGFWHVIILGLLQMLLALHRLADIEYETHLARWEEEGHGLDDTHRPQPPPQLYSPQLYREWVALVQESGLFTNTGTEQAEVNTDDESSDWVDEFEF